MNSTRPSTKTDCIEWTKYRDKGGYGVLRSGGKTMLAHRVAWERANGPIPEGMKVLHKCDNPPCVNPDHLSLGTQQDNIRDCFLKGRISRAPRNTGAEHALAKLTEQTAVRIKMLRGVLPARVVAETLGLSGPWVGAIMRGEQWKHVTSETRYRF